MYLIGVDPGLKGGIAAVRIHGGEICTVHVADTPIDTEYDYIPSKLRLLVGEYLERCGFAKGEVPPVFIERVQMRPSNATQATFMCGFGLGLWIMALDSYGVEPVVLEPKRWRRLLGLEVTSDRLKRKRDSVARAKVLWPSIDIKGPRGGRRDGRAEAFLIALAGASQLGLGKFDK